MQWQWFNLSALLIVVNICIQKVLLFCVEPFEQHRKMRISPDILWVSTVHSLNSDTGTISNCFGPYATWWQVWKRHPGWIAAQHFKHISYEVCYDPVRQNCFALILFWFKECPFGPTTMTSSHCIFASSIRDHLWVLASQVKELLPSVVMIWRQKENVWAAAENWFPTLFLIGTSTSRDFSSWWFV